MKKVYETERLILKVLDKSYAELVVDYYLRNKSFLEEWEAVKSEEFYTKQYQEEQLYNELANIENKRSFRLWVFKRELKLCSMNLDYIELKPILCQKINAH